MKLSLTQVGLAFLCLLVVPHGGSGVPVGEKGNLRRKLEKAAKSTKTPVADSTKKPKSTKAPEYSAKLPLFTSGSWTSRPSEGPSASSSPSALPSNIPSAGPSMAPSDASQVPSGMPSMAPSETPSFSGIPSSLPSSMPSSLPSREPSAMPSSSIGPSSLPSGTPSQVPSVLPSSSGMPSEFPSESALPSESVEPTSNPTVSAAPSESRMPSSVPSMSSMPSVCPGTLVFNNNTKMIQDSAVNCSQLECPEGNCTSCPSDGYLGLDPATDISYCTTCNSSCTSCLNATWCTSCQDDPTLVEGQCIIVPIDCVADEIFNIHTDQCQSPRQDCQSFVFPGVCRACFSGYAKLETEDSVPYCSPCTSSCQICTENYPLCTICQEGYDLIDGLCVLPS